MFFKELTSEQKNLYIKLLKEIGSLSTLFNDGSTPYLYYRVHEIIFCYSTGAKNLSRKDCAIDAIISDTGIGLKTFIDKKGKSLQKIAEFNEMSPKLRSMKDPEKIARLVSSLRNRRINFTVDTFNLKSVIYHCVTRKEKI